MCIIITLLMCVPVWAGPGNEFLLLDTSVRSAGVAGAFSGFRAGPDGIHYNPASISGMKGSSVYLENLSWLNDLSYQYISAGTGISGWGFNLSAGLFNMADIAFYDENEDYQKDMEYRDLFCALTAGKKIKGFYAGAGVKYVRRVLDTYSAATVLFDIGLIRVLSLKYAAFLKNTNKDNFSLGLVLRNIGPGLCFSKERTENPSEIVLGACTEIVKNKRLVLRLLADAGKFLYDDFDLKTGVELGYRDIFFFRCGRSFLYTESLGLGLGLKLDLTERLKGDFSYALTLIEDYHDQHSIGIRFSF
ncbi:MAG: PorV/PorQ family protein [bacterium]|nr:PorV/PorQ family protein [bacterium]